MQKINSSRHHIASPAVPEEEHSIFDAGSKYPTLDKSPSQDHQALILVQN
jgi:hypothetical protein